MLAVCRVTSMQKFWRLVQRVYSYQIARRHISEDLNFKKIYTVMGT
jgi:hypothetical protein